MGEPERQLSWARSHIEALLADAVERFSDPGLGDFVHRWECGVWSGSECTCGYVEWLARARAALARCEVENDRPETHRGT